MMQSGDSAKQLTERQELLLSRYYDGEVSIIDRLRAKRLLRTNPAAPAFLASLQSIANYTKSATPTSDTACDLWHRISARIESEERAAIYLGERAALPVTAREGLVASLLSSHIMLGGVSGAAVAAVLLLSLTPSSSSKNVTIIPTAPSALVNANSGFRPVGLEGAVSGTARANRPLTPMELDWMRGDGPLRIIQTPQSSSAIIWVNRKKRAQAVTSPAPSPIGRTTQTKGVEANLQHQSE